MSLYLFDTDTLTLFQRLHPVIIRNVFYHLADDIRLTSISVEEQLGGWFTMLRNARTPQQTETAHTRLSEAVRWLATWDIVPLTAAAATRFHDLLRQRLNVGGNDLRVASIALELGATVVTRNLRDFRRVPGLPCEDWSV
ncbi:MAG: type II toxin-antitoxin system VapC family toxin [Gemmataceae bacterium]